jgi:hypothetical protein
MSRRMLLLLLLAALCAAAFVDQVVCEGMTYHDYAAGIDRRFQCPWK